MKNTSFAKMSPKHMIFLKIRPTTQCSGRQLAVLQLLVLLLPLPALCLHRPFLSSLLAALPVVDLLGE